MKMKHRISSLLLAILFVLACALPAAASPPKTDPAKATAQTAQTADPKSASSAAAPAFTDVAETDYFAKPVSWAVENGITVGTGNNQFSPHATCTVAQILTFIWRANGSPASGKTCAFKDLASTSPYYGACCWATEKGLLKDQNVTPDTPCTRSLMAVFFWRSAGSPKVDLTGMFHDVPLNAEATTAIAWVAKQGITNGTSATDFSPETICTRAQIVTLLYRNLVEPIDPKPLPALSTHPSNQPKPEPEQKPETPKPEPEKSTKGFAAYGLTPTAKLNTPYPYTTCCMTDYSKTTTGTVTVTNYNRGTLEDDGYNMIAFDAVAKFTDDNSWDYGVYFNWSATDYYLYEDGGKDADLYDGNHNSYSITWNGKTYDGCYVKLSHEVDRDGRTALSYFHAIARVPKGYDGLVFWFANHSGENDPVDEGKHLSARDCLIMFRCD